MTAGSSICCRSIQTFDPATAAGRVTHSGGLAFSSHGTTVRLTNFIVNTAGATGSQGIGFAIPIDIARPIMVQAVAGEPLTYVFTAEGRWLRYRAERKIGGDVKGDQDIARQMSALETQISGV